jgi:hypothetical protein
MKDRFNIEGLESASGYASWLGEKKDSASEGTLVKILRSMGAVFFLKTNVPLSMLVSEYLHFLSSDFGFFYFYVVSCKRLIKDLRRCWKQAITLSDRL